MPGSEECRPVSPVATDHRNSLHQRPKARHFPNFLKRNIRRQSDKIHLAVRTGKISHNSLPSQSEILVFIRCMQASTEIEQLSTQIHPVRNVANCPIARLEDPPFCRGKLYR